MLTPLVQLRVMAPAEPSHIARPGIVVVVRIGLVAATYLAWLRTDQAKAL